MNLSLNLSDKFQEAADFIAAAGKVEPRIGLVLGSGLSPLADEITDPVAIPYDQIPHFPVSTVEGHAGRLVLGRLNGQPVCAMQGRFHFYEGYDALEVTFPIRVMCLLGVKVLILTNAAGGVNPEFKAGDLMLINDHINFVGMGGNSPLHGPNLDQFGLRFPSMTSVYSRRLRQLAHQSAREEGLALREGVYAWLAGPSFETPAEVRMMRILGTDAVGMSTVPEAIVAVHGGMEVMAFSSITNVAVDEIDSDRETTHEEVLDTGKQIVPRLSRLILGIVSKV